MSTWPTNFTLLVSPSNKIKKLKPPLQKCADDDKRTFSLFPVYLKKFKPVLND